MKNIKGLIRRNLLTLGLVFAAALGNAQNISAHYFGQNAWMPDTIGNANNCVDPPCVLNGKLHQKWGEVENSKAQIIRFGGISPDENMPTHYQYVKMIDSIRANGMEPVIQVPFANYRYTAAQAADIVTYLNVTKQKNIKYWIIGNEPNLGYFFTSAQQIAAYFKPFASAMKTVDPTILIIGPEIAWFDQSIINGLTTPNGAYDITGRDANGRFYCDIISFHTYPFNGSQNRSTVISKLMSANSFNDNLVYLNGRIAACNTAHNRTGNSALKTAVTEANINWQNPSNDDLYGVGANSFIGGQFVAEMLAIGMKNNVDFINMWSVVEGNSTASSIGYLYSNGTRKPAYYHFQMMAENFRGTYIHGTSNQPNAKAFGCYDPQKITVMIMNQDQSQNFPYTVRLNSTSIQGTNPLKINVNANVPMEYSGTIQNQSTIVLTFNAAGTIIRKCEYSLAGNAVSNQAPTCTDYNIPTSVNNATPVPDEGPFKLKNVFPNPSNGTFNIQLTRRNGKGAEEFQIELYNLIGQQVFSKKYSFITGEEEIKLHPDIAAGEYIVRIREGETENYMINKIMIQK